jgi:hypothetical protein
MWIYKDVEFTSEMIEDNYGFVYMIINTLSDMKYIGKKYFIKRKHEKISESDWKIYRSSCKLLLNDIERSGIENFKFNIIQLYKTKSATDLGEIDLQIYNNVLTSRLSDNSLEYYNRHIGNYLFIKPEYTSEATRLKMQLSQLGKKHSAETKAKISESKKGSIPWNKNKKGYHSKEFIAWLRINSAGNTYHLGKSHTEESKKKMSEKNKGKLPWNTGKSHSDETKEKISNSLKGKKQTDETKEKRSKSMKGKLPWNTGKKLSDEHKKKLKEAAEKRKNKEVGL